MKIQLELTEDQNRLLRQLLEADIREIRHDMYDGKRGGISADQAIAFNQRLIEQLAKAKTSAPIER